MRIALGFGLVRENAQKEEDAPIVSFATIRKTLEGLIADGKLRSIDRIRLGYVLYVDPNDSSIGWAVPTWQVHGEIYHTKDEEPVVAQVSEEEEAATIKNIGYFYIQARTGEFVDPSDQNPSRRNVPKVITWDEVK